MFVWCGNLVWVFACVWYCLCACVCLYRLDLFCDFTGFVLVLFVSGLLLLFGCGCFLIVLSYNAVVFGWVWCYLNCYFVLLLLGRGLFELLVLLC